MHPIYEYPDATWVCITGGPCAGKSTGISRIRERLEEEGYRVVLVEETATKLSLRGLGPFAPWRSPIHFQRVVLRSTLAAEAEAYTASRLLADGARHTVFLCDRGALDGMAYVDPYDFQRMVAREQTTIVELLSHYAIVIHLVTAADGAEEFFTHANNTARSETPEQARALDARTRHAWHGHPHLRIVDNSTDFDGKMRRAFNHLARVLHMPEAYEIERKYLIRTEGDLPFPEQAVTSRITQQYLVSNGNSMRRVRMREQGGACTYYYTEKRDTDTPGKRVEIEHQISKDEYVRLVETDIDPALTTLVKLRTTFSADGHYYEVDTYEVPAGLVGLRILEVEIPTIDTPVTIPSWLAVEDVTEDPRYSNYELARCGRP